VSLRDELSEELYAALRGRYAVSPLIERYPDLTVDDAYAISLGFLARRQNDGERVVGKKIGVTSKAVQDMLGVHQPDFRLSSPIGCVPAKANRHRGQSADRSACRGRDRFRA
jgi:2-keto-4-pentenoate hydratase